MYKICFLLFYLLAGLEISAQQKDSMVQRQLIIPPEQHSSAGVKNQVVLNASGLIHVKKGDIFEIEPNVDYPARKLHFLRGVFKTLGFGALAYQANQSLHPFGGNVSKMNRQQQGAKSILPSLGIGLALSYPDFAGNKNKSRPSLHYLFYNKDSVLISQQTVKLNKKTHLPLTGKINQDGFLKILLTDKADAPDQPADVVLNLQSSLKPQTVNTLPVNTLVYNTSTFRKTADSTTLLPTSDSLLKIRPAPRMDIALAADDEGFGNEDGDGDGNIDLPPIVDDNDAEDFFDNYTDNGETGIITDYDGVDGHDAFYIYDPLFDIWTLNHWTGDLDPKTVAESTGIPQGQDNIPDIITDISILNYTSGGLGYLLSDNGTIQYNYEYNSGTGQWDMSGGSVVTSNPGTASSPNPRVIKDTSVVNHPNVNCVVDHLLDDITSNGLKSILGAFTSSLGSNVIIKAVPGLGTEGKTLQPNSQNNPTNDYVIEIDADRFYDTTITRIYLAETIIHEAFHAMLLQKEIAAYNTTDISKWQVPPLPTDSTLLELYNDYVYYKDSLKISSPSMEQIQHDWEANHINLIAAALEDFVETNYKTTAASVGNDIKAYESFIYLSDKDIGSSNTRFSESNATALGGSTAILSYFGSFGAGNPVNCSN